MDEIIRNYEIAKKVYAEWNVDTDTAIEKLKELPLSIHCWQGDDVTGFEGTVQLTGGIMATGSHPGKARTGEELRADIDKAFLLIPGTKKLNLHAMYAETNGKKVNRDELKTEHFANWLAWAKDRKIGLDFNPSLFSHYMFRDNMSLSHPNREIRKFWIEHCKKTREIGAEFGRQLGIPCVNNIWIADGLKDMPADRRSYRERLKDSLDEIFEKKYEQRYLVDAVESKLFGIGTESFVAGSLEFYLGYAMENNLALTLDSGHFHPTETIADKISSVLLYVHSILLHVSRGIRWDSDHVTTLTEDTQLIARECVRCGSSRIHYGLDYFDASINRIAAWVIGARSFQKALLIALLEPGAIKEAEDRFDYTMRLALMEETRQLPWGAVWDKFCLDCNVPAGIKWLDEVKEYEKITIYNRKYSGAIHKLSTFH